MSKSKNGVKYNGIVFLVIGMVFLAAFMIWIPVAIFSFIRWIISGFIGLIEAGKWRIIA